MEQLKEWLKSPSVSIIDVRNPMEFATERIDGAVNIPLSEIMHHIDSIKQMSKPIVVHCLSGGRSATAVSILKQSGLDEVYNGGGIAMMKSLRHV